MGCIGRTHRSSYIFYTSTYDVKDQQFSLIEGIDMFGLSNLRFGASPKVPAPEPQALKPRAKNFSWKAASTETPRPADKGGKTALGIFGEAAKKLMQSTPSNRPFDRPASGRNPQASPRDHSAGSHTGNSTQGSQSKPALDWRQKVAEGTKISDQLEAELLLGSKPAAPATQPGTASDAPPSWQDLVAQGIAASDQLEAELLLGSKPAAPATQPGTASDAPPSWQDLVAQGIAASDQLEADLLQGSKPAAPATQPGAASEAPASSKQETTRVGDARKDYNEVKSKLDNWLADQKDSANLEAAKKLSILEQSRDSIGGDLDKGLSQLEKTKAKRKKELVAGLETLKKMKGDATKQMLANKVGADEATASGRVYQGTAVEQAAEKLNYRNAIAARQTASAAIAEQEDELARLDDDFAAITSTLLEDAEAEFSKVNDDIDAVKKENKDDLEMLDDSAKSSLEFETAQISERYGVTFKNK
ncbi:MAG: hypothetical protein ACI82I_003030 [Gammaproteobacteria bacterium]|jgi:hypothetical protein